MASDLSYSPELLERLDRCEERIGYQFNDRQHLHAALIHASGADNRLLSNERLEFLGDAVLGYVACDLLYHQFEEYLEGDLTKVKSVIVSRETCARISRRMDLEDCLILGKGMKTRRRVPKSLMADVFEAIIAAIYLDGGHEKAREFLIPLLEVEIEAALDGRVGGNFKSQLQQLAQRDFGATPIYHLVDEKGPDHSKCFHISAEVGERKFSAAWGRNKKEAEQKAACNALCEMRGEPAPNTSDL